MPDIMLTDVDSDAFVKEVLEPPVPVVVEFFSPVCRFCRRFDPIIEALTEKYAESVKFCRVNATENLRLAMEYNVFSVPTTFVFRGGRVSWRVNGFVPAEELAPQIESVLR